MFNSVRYAERVWIRSAFSDFQIIGRFKSVWIRVAVFGCADQLGNLASFELLRTVSYV